MTRKAIAVHDDAKRSLNNLWAFVKVAQHEASKITGGIPCTILTDSIHYDPVNNCYTVLIAYENQRVSTKSGFYAAMEALPK